MTYLYEQLIYIYAGLSTYVGQNTHYGSQPTEGYASVQQAQLELTSLDSAVQGYFEAGLAPSTKQSFQSGINRFLRFCSTYHVHTPLPVTQSTLCYFISALAEFYPIVGNFCWYKFLYMYIWPKSSQNEL